MYSAKKQNNYAFIDSQNLNLSIRECGWILDFCRFRNYLRDKYSIRKAYLFIGYLAGNESLYTELQQNGYILIFKPTLVLPGGQAKGNVDNLSLKLGNKKPPILLTVFCPRKSNLRTNP